MDDNEYNKKAILNEDEIGRVTLSLSPTSIQYATTLNRLSSEPGSHLESQSQSCKDVNDKKIEKHEININYADNDDSSNNNNRYNDNNGNSHTNKTDNNEIKYESMMAKKEEINVIELHKTIKLEAILDEVKSSVSLSAVDLEPVPRILLSQRMFEAKNKDNNLNQNMERKDRSKDDMTDEMKDEEEERDENKVKNEDKNEERNANENTNKDIMKNLSILKTTDDLIPDLSSSYFTKSLLDSDDKSPFESNWYDRPVYHILWYDII